MDTTTPENLWRLTIDPDSAPGADPVDFCRAQSIIGFGWGQYDPSDFRENTIDGRSAKSAFRILYERMNKGDHVWTYDNTEGAYYITRIKDKEPNHGTGGDWNHFDIHHYREADWSQPIAPNFVPGAIKRRFTTQGTLSRMKLDSAWNKYSRYLYEKSDSLKNEITGVDYQRLQEALNSQSNEKIRNLFNAEEWENLIGLFLQEREGWRLIKSSTYSGQRDVECTFTRSTSSHSERATMQVKTGQANVLYSDVEPYLDTENSYCYVYTQDDQSRERLKKHDNLKFIQTEEVVTFLEDNLQLLTVPMILKLRIMLSIDFPSG